MQNKIKKHLVELKKYFLAFSPKSESQNEYAKDGKREQNDKFSSLGHSINTSCLYELQTCSRPNKVQEKTFFYLKIFMNLLFLYQKGLQQQVLMISLML